MTGRLISGILISAVYLLSPIQKSSVHDFTIHVNGDIPDVSYGLYEDRQCEKPLTDEDGKQILLKTDEEGNASVQLQQNAFWMKETGTPDGWYQDEAIRYVTKDSLTVSKDKIQLRFGVLKGNERVSAHLQLKEDGGDVIADWTSEGLSYPLKDEKRVKLKAGETYIVSASDIPEGYYAKPLKVEVQKYAHDQKQRSFSIEMIPYALLTVSNRLYDQTPASSSVFRLYQDKACRDLAEDIYEKEIQLTMDAEGKAEAAVETGTYYLKEEDTEMHHYIDPEVYPLDISEEAVSFAHQDVPVQAIVRLKDEKTQKETAGTFSIDDMQTYASGETVLLERGKTYQVTSASWPEGYHATKAIKIDTSQYQKEPLTADLSLSPFSIHVVMSDQETGRSLSGGQYQILDQNGNVKQIFAMKDGPEINSLADNQSYILHEVKAPQGYIPMEDIPFVIDGQSHAYHIETKRRHYYHLSVNAKTAGKKTDQTVIGIYTDARCTKQAADITGKKADASKTMSLHAGTYWLQLQDPDKYYCTSDPVKVTLQADKPFENQITMDLKRPDGKIIVEDREGHQIKGSKLVVKDEEGKEIGSFISQGEDTLSGLDFADQIKAGHTYKIMMDSLPAGLYKAGNKEVSLKTTEKNTDSPETSSLHIQPYAVITMSELCDGTAVSGGRWKLYSDKECTHPAKDTDQKICDKVTGEDGLLSFALVKGDYWLKQEEAPEYCYRNPEVYPVHIDPYNSWQYHQNTETHKAELIVQLIDKYGEHISGGLFEVRNREGKLVSQFENHGDIRLSGNWLKPGESYTIHERMTPDGYQMNQTDIVCHIPETMPDRTPVLQIRYRSADTASAKLPAKVADHVNSEKPSKPFLIAEVIILIASILLLLKMKSLHKK